MKQPLLAAIRQNWRNILLALGARVAENASYCIFTVFALTYVTTQLSLSRAAILNALVVASLAQLISIPLWGSLSDRIGRRPVYIFGTLFLALWAFPFFWLINTGNLFLIYVALILALALAHAAMYAPQAAFFAELFGTKVRFSGVSLGYQLAAPLAGGLAPMIATALFEHLHKTDLTI